MDERKHQKDDKWIIFRINVCWMRERTYDGYDGRMNEWWPKGRAAKYILISKITFFGVL